MDMLNTSGIGQGANLEELLHRAAQLSRSHLGLFAQRVNELAQRPENEADMESSLVDRIRKIIPSSVTRRYHQLNSKHQKLAISDKEKEEMLLLTDFIEIKSAERLGLLAELAKLRRMSISDVVKELRLTENTAKSQ